MARSEITDKTNLENVTGGGILVDPIGDFWLSWTPGYLVKTKNVEANAILEDTINEVLKTNAQISKNI